MTAPRDQRGVGEAAKRARTSQSRRGSACGRELECVPFHRTRLAICDVRLGRRESSPTWKKEERCAALFLLAVAWPAGRKTDLCGNGHAVAEGCAGQEVLLRYIRRAVLTGECADRKRQFEERCAGLVRAAEAVLREDRQSRAGVLRHSQLHSRRSCAAQTTRLAFGSGRRVVGPRSTPPSRRLAGCKECAACCFLTLTSHRRRSPRT